ncbi:unnamed protein product [Phytophthora lilii]|uniref:Unnamed protein product n=1 Tax=Phytophthora lilii TaxID=2077276 RepID=A0A9W6THS2_9STRA|nr:unnamed protein product [Phytophthora lilii]
MVHFGFCVVALKKNSYLATVDQMKIAPIATIFFLVCYSSMAAEVWLYSHGSNAKYTIDTYQRCYTVEDSWSDRAVRASWKKLPKQSFIFFYKDTRCRGDKVASGKTPAGSYSFEKEDNLNLAVSSFMVKTFSDDPTEGYQDIHVDDAVPIIDIFEKAEVNETITFLGSSE